MAAGLFCRWGIPRSARGLGSPVSEVPWHWHASPHDRRDAGVRPASRGACGRTERTPVMRAALARRQPPGLEGVSACRNQGVFLVRTARVEWTGNARGWGDISLLDRRLLWRPHNARFTSGLGRGQPGRRYCCNALAGQLWPITCSDRITLPSVKTGRARQPSRRASSRFLSRAERCATVPGAACDAHRTRPSGERGASRGGRRGGCRC